jgi:hypothetical protein
VEVDLIAVCKLVGWPVLGGVVHDGRDLRAGAKLPGVLQSGVPSHETVTTSRVDEWLQMTSQFPHSNTNTEERSKHGEGVLTTAQ